MLRFASCLAAARLAAAEPSAACVAYDDDVAELKFPGLALPYAGLELGSNSYGVGGRRTTLRQCLRDEGGGRFGWNWTRGQTEPSCALTDCQAPPCCKAPDCFADFSFAAAAYGVSPWGQDTGASNMPVRMDQLSSFTVAQDVSWTWSDDMPGFGPPETGAEDSRRVRFIYDMWLTRERPTAGSSVASSITDEVIIDLAANPGFPGSQPPGCLHPGDKFSNVSWGPVLEDAVFDGYNWYDYYWTDHDDAVPGNHTRYSSFRRKTSNSSQDYGPGISIPRSVDVKPFVEAIKKMWPGEDVGPWLGHVAVSTELYDHSSGEVTFHSLPTFEPVYAADAASSAVIA